MRVHLFSCISVELAFRQCRQCCPSFPHLRSVVAYVKLVLQEHEVPYAFVPYSLMCLISALVRVQTCRSLKKPVVSRKKVSESNGTVETTTNRNSSNSSSEFRDAVTQKG
jgi:hypothetical protein